MVPAFVFLFGTGLWGVVSGTGVVVVAVPASGVVVVPLLDGGVVADFVGFL
jgi:hypothetical protein